MENALRPIRRRHIADVCHLCRSQLASSPRRITPSSVAQRRTHFTHGRAPYLANASGQHEDDPALSLPRWQRTPRAMQAPVSTRRRNDNDDFPCNEDPKKLDAMLVKMLGRGGDQILPDELKWLAVTHKSFDHGRRGFNDRLAIYGTRVSSRLK